MTSDGRINPHETVGDRPHLQSDAAVLAGLTGIPTVVWGVLWIGVAVTVSVLLFRHAWRNA